MQSSSAYCFLVTTAAYLTGNGILAPLVDASENLTALSSNKSMALTGALLELVNAMGVIGIGALLFPILRRYDEGSALGYFGSRVVESALLFVSVLSPLLLLELSKNSLAGIAEANSFQALGAFAVNVYHLAFQVAMISLSVGSLLFCGVLFKSKIVPRFLSVLGFVGYVCLLAYSVLQMFEVNGVEVLFIPGALFELALPIWLIVKGFDKGLEKSQ